MSAAATPDAVTVHDEPIWNDHWEALEIGARGNDTVLILPLIFTHAIITVPHGNPWAYDERWCYHDKHAAIHAAQTWLRDGANEPTGWHRHPSSGRRRPDGDPAKEYVNP